MSITSALSSALSGLSAQSRAAEVVASNLANLTTEGYARRNIELTAAGQDFGGGVRISNVTRHVDSGVLADRRLADSSLAGAETRAGFLEGVQRTVGSPDASGSLSARLAAFEASLVTAAGRPEDGTSLQAVALRASELADAFNTASDDIQARRMAADAGIETAVGTINTALEQIGTLNARIATATHKGQDTATLEHDRQRRIDSIATFLPLREIPRENGTIALMTPGGAVLLDGTVAKLDFTRANMITPETTLGAGGLSGLTINGRDVPPSGPASPLGDGRLAALFELRDSTATTAQAGLDALARDVTERLQAPGLDPTTGPGAAGLFTDGATAFTTADETGIAGRMTLNPAINPQDGTTLHRLRDGLGAASPGPSGDASLLNSAADALAARRVPASGPFAGQAHSLADHAAAFASRLGQDARAADAELSFTATQRGELQTMLLRDGVDSDAETSRLLVIEQAYGANARMIQTLDEMMQTLLRI